MEHGKEEVPKCEGCLVRDAQPAETWYYTLTKCMLLCTPCARRLARDFPEFVQSVCAPIKKP